MLLSYSRTCVSLESPWAVSSGQRGGIGRQPQSWSSIHLALGSAGPGNSASWGKVSSEAEQYWAVSLGFPGLTLLLTMLKTRLPRVYCSPPRLPSFPQPASPCGSSDKAGGGQGARGKDACHLHVTSSAAAGIRFSLISQRWIRPLAS